jgi:hypothetical protein
MAGSTAHNILASRRPGRSANTVKKNLTLTTSSGVEIVHGGPKSSGRDLFFNSRITYLSLPPYVFAQLMLPWRENARSSSVAAALGGNITLAFDFVRALLGIR